MIEIYGKEAVYGNRLCINLTAIKELLTQLSEIGLVSFNCDFYFPLNRHQTASKIEHLDALECGDDLHTVGRIFFTATGDDCQALGNFVRDQKGNYSFSTKNRLQSFTLAGIFNDFEIRNGDGNGSCPKSLSTKGLSIEAHLINSHSARPTQAKNSKIWNSEASRSSSATSNETTSPRPWLKRLSFGSVIAIAGLIIYFWQAQSGSRQAASAERDGEAVFAFTKLAPHSFKDSANINLIPFDRKIENLGKAPATNVVLQCSSSDRHAPYLHLGTIGASSSKELHYDLSTDVNDQLHGQESFCFQDIHVGYTDGTGQHFITFDSDGNARREDKFP